MKKIYILPNVITTANIVCGVLAMIASMKGEFVHAVWFVVISAVCDSLDGRVARMAKATSSFGVQYDSLADLASFGIAPAIMLFTYSLNQLDRLGIAIATFYVVCAALRLARFNVSVEEKQAEKIEAARKKIRRGYFQGLPSPASAGMIVAAVLFQSEFHVLDESFKNYFFLVLCGALASFMVSSIPFPSFKEVNWRAKGKAWILLIPVVVILFIIQMPEIALFSIGFTYLILSLFWAVYMCVIRERKLEGQGLNQNAPQV